MAAPKSRLQSHRWGQCENWTTSIFASQRRQKQPLVLVRHPTSEQRRGPEGWVTTRVFAPASLLISSGVEAVGAYPDGDVECDDATGAYLDDGCLEDVEVADVDATTATGGRDARIATGKLIDALVMGSSVDIGNEMEMCEELMAEADAEGVSDSSDGEFAKALAANRPRNVPRECTGGGKRGKSVRGGKRIRARHLKRHLLLWAGQLPIHRAGTSLRSLDSDFNTVTKLSCSSASVTKPRRRGGCGVPDTCAWLTLAFKIKLGGVGTPGMCTWFVWTVVYSRFKASRQVRCSYACGPMVCGIQIP